MATLSDNLYSRFVVWTKIILPLAALAILSGLFLFSKEYDPTEGITLTDGELKEIARRERISQPRYAGTISDGISVSLLAEEASPKLDGSDAMEAIGISTNIEMPDGSIIEVVAAKGVLDNSIGQGEFTGGVVLETSIGYQAVTEGLDFNLVDVHIKSQGEITATTPSGKLKAGEMEITLQKKTSEDDKPGYLLVFQKGVKLVYLPKTESP